MKTRLYDSTSLTEFLPRNICFAEQDADDGAGGGASGGDDGADGGEDAPDYVFEEEEGNGSEGGDDDSDELEIGPAKYRVPKPVKEAWNGVQKSTQAEKEALAAQRAEVEAEKTRYQENLRVSAAYIKEIGKIQAINEQLADYDKLTVADWTAWSAQDAAAAQKAQTAYTAMRIERDKLIAGVNEKEGQMKANQEKERNEFLAKSERELAAKIKDWSPAKKDALLKVGTEFGFSAQELQGVAHDPRVMSMLDEVSQARAAKARAQKVAADAKAAREAETGRPAPVARARGNAGGTNSLADNVSMETFARNLTKRLAKR